MTTDRYIYVKSDESDAYFDNNKTYKFKVHLQLPLYFYGKWKVTLTEFHATEIVKSSNIGRIYVYTDLCKKSIMFGEERPLLRRLEKIEKPNGTSHLTHLFTFPSRNKNFVNLKSI